MARKSTKPTEIKAEAVKAAPVVKDEPKAAVKAEPAAAASAVKEAPEAKKTAAAKRTAAKKTVGKTAAKKTADKPVKAPAKAEKPAVQTARAVKAADAEKPAAKRGGRKPKAATIETICDKVAKKASKAKAGKITGTIAVDIEIYGWENGENKHMYIEVRDGALTVAPYNYDEFNVRVAVPFADAVAFVDGKLTLKDAVASGKMYAEGVIGDAIKIVSLFE